MAKRKGVPRFTTLSKAETKMVYRDKTFILKEQKVGVYGIGSCISVYQMDKETLKKEFLVCAGWTASDNHSDGGKKALLPGTKNTLEECKKATVKYIDDLMD